MLQVVGTHAQCCRCPVAPASGDLQFGGNVLLGILKLWIFGLSHAGYFAHAILLSGCKQCGLTRRNQTTEEFEKKRIHSIWSVSRCLLRWILKIRNPSVRSSVEIVATRFLIEQVGKAWHSLNFQSKIPCKQHARFRGIGYPEVVRCWPFEIQFSRGDCLRQISLMLCGSSPIRRIFCSPDSQHLSWACGSRSRCSEFRH